MDIHCGAYFESYRSPFNFSKLNAVFEFNTRAIKFIRILSRPHHTVYVLVLFFLYVQYTFDLDGIAHRVRVCYLQLRWEKSLGKYGLRRRGTSPDNFSYNCSLLPHVECIITRTCSRNRKKAVNVSL